MTLFLQQVTYSQEHGRVRLDVNRSLFSLQRAEEGSETLEIPYTVQLGILAFFFSFCSLGTAPSPRVHSFPFSSYRTRRFDGVSD
ncbi:hypothetical protein AOLI_G00033000 [Acnodon oligacanthus]